MDEFFKNLSFKVSKDDVEVECGQPFDIFDTPFPFGVPPLHKTPNEILDEIWLETLDVHPSKRCFSAPLDPIRLFSIDVTEEDFAVLEMPSFSQTSKVPNSKGIREIFLEKEAPEDVSGEDLFKDLLTVPPGFEEGADFGKPPADDTPARHVLNFADLLSGDPFLLETTPESKPENEEDLATATDVAKLAGQRFSDVLHISEVEDGCIERLEWAEQEDVTKPMPDFEDRVPCPALTWPFELDTFQKKAIIHIEAGDSVFVSAHTSAGKTVVAEYAIAHARQQMGRAIYTSPVKALSNEKYRDFKEIFGDVGIVTGDVQINQKAQCVIMTTEILRNMLYGQSDVLENLRWVIFDECHYINDPERGVVWEEVLIMLPRHVGFVLLSATVPHALRLADWIGRIKQRKLYVFTTSKRPVPLVHELYVHGHLYRLMNREIISTESYTDACLQMKKAAAEWKNTEDSALYEKLIGHLRQKGQLPVICFVFSRFRCDKQAAHMGRLQLNSAKEEKAVMAFVRQRVLSQLSESDRQLPQVLALPRLLQTGVGVHHSGVLPILKEAVEMLFQQGLIKVLFATETFSMGVNMPARTVVFDDHLKHDGGGRRPLKPSEYIQMAGRAGRRGKDPDGLVIMMCKREVPPLPLLHSMLLGRAAELESRFRVTYSMILNLKDSAERRVEDIMRDSFLENFRQSETKQRIEQCQRLETELSRLGPLGCASCEGNVPLSLLEEAAAKRRLAWQGVLAKAHGHRLFSPGRLLLADHPPGPEEGKDGGGGPPLLGVLDSVLVREQKLSLWALTDAQQQAPRAGGGEDGTGRPPEVSAAQPQASGAPPPLPWPLSKKISLPQGAVSIKRLTVSFSDVLCVYSKTVQVDGKQTMSAHQQKVLAQQLLDLVERHPAGLPSINVVKDLRLSHFDLVDAVKQAQALETKLLASPCLKCPLFASHFVQECRRGRLAAELEQAQSLLSEESLVSMAEYRRHVRALQRLGFMDGDQALTIKGRLARTLHTHEVMLTEVLLEDSLMALGHAELAGLLSSFVCEQRSRKYAPVIPKPLKEAVEKFRLMARHIGDVEHECEFKSPPGDYIEQFSFSLCEAVYEWAKKTSFVEIMRVASKQEVQEGTIVRCVQRLYDLLKDAAAAAKLVGNDEICDKMKETLRLLQRDIVYPGSLYLN
ncbi:superkiller complex protein 2-like [Haemaphysalis longicornis]